MLWDEWKLVYPESTETKEKFLRNVTKAIGNNERIRKHLQEPFKDLIEEWKKLIMKIDGTGKISKSIAIRLFKMYCTKNLKYPLELARDKLLATNGKKFKWIMFILVHSDPNCKVEMQFMEEGHFNPIHLLLVLNYQYQF